MYNVTGVRCTNTILPGKVNLSMFSRCVKSAHLVNLLPGQLGHRMLFSSPRVPGRLPPASFFQHICRIVRVSAKEQVPWVNTRGIVALMEHAHSWWDRAKMNLVRFSMGINIFALKHKRSIARFILPSLPFPASVGFFNLGPEVVIRGPHLPMMPLSIARTLADRGSAATYTHIAHDIPPMVVRFVRLQYTGVIEKCQVGVA